MRNPVSGLVWFWPEQISAVTDAGLEHFRPDRTNTTCHLLQAQNLTQHTARICSNIL